MYLATPPTYSSTNGVMQPSHGYALSLFMRQPDDAIGETNTDRVTRYIHLGRPIELNLLRKSVKYFKLCKINEFALMQEPGHLRSQHAKYCTSIEILAS